MSHILKPLRSAAKAGLGLCMLLSVLVSSCIEPPLKLPAQDLIVDLPLVITDLDVTWNLDVDWRAKWYYGWDNRDRELWGEIAYPEPTNYEVRRYFVGPEPRAPHTAEGRDAFTIYGNTFRRSYQFGYYDLLVWSNIDSKDQTQVVLIDESDLEDVKATTTVTRSISLVPRNEGRATALYNQPEIFYSAYPRDIYISRYPEDYDYFNEDERVWVKRVSCTLTPLVYIYLVQIILYNNNGRVRGISGDCAISAFSSGTSVNTGHTFNNPCMVYFNTRMKTNLPVENRTADIIGGKLTTYGLCDMDGYVSGSRAQYTGSRGELPNYLYFDLVMSGGSVQTLSADVTKQCQAQSHGGVITVEIDCNELDNPSEDGSGSLFNPKVEDYEELEYDIPM